MKQEKIISRMQKTTFLSGLVLVTSIGLLLSPPAGHSKANAVLEREQEQAPEVNFSPPEEQARLIPEEAHEHTHEPVTLPELAGVPVADFAFPVQDNAIIVEGLERVAALGGWRLDINESSVDVNGIIQAEFFNESAYLLIETPNTEMTEELREIFSNILVIDLRELVSPGKSAIEKSWQSSDSLKRVDVLSGEEETLLAIRSTGTLSTDNYSIILAINKAEKLSSDFGSLLEIGKRVTLSN